MRIQGFLEVIRKLQTGVKHDYVRTCQQTASGFGGSVRLACPSADALLILVPTVPEIDYLSYFEARNGLYGNGKNNLFAVLRSFGED